MLNLEELALSTLFACISCLIFETFYLLEIKKKETHLVCHEILHFRLQSNRIHSN